mgnify:CR=1 FL=1
MTFNESTILEDDLEDLIEDIDEYEDETALLVQKMNNPYSEYDPKNFTLQQKLKWMKNEPEEEFQAQFEQNQSRFKIDVAKLKQDEIAKQTYNVYG